MKHKHEIRSCAVGLMYLENALDHEDLLTLERKLSECNITLIPKETPPRYINGIEDFFPQIQVFLSSDIVQMICLGLATNAIYGGIKHFLISLRQIVKKKPFTKVQNGKVDTNATPTIHFNIGQMHAVLPMDIDDEKFKYFVDKAFESVNEQSIAKETYFIYSEKTGEAKKYTKHELVQKAYQESQLDNDQ